MKVGPQQCIFILFLISLAKGISFTPSVDFFFHDHVVVVVVVAANPLKRRERFHFVAVWSRQLVVCCIIMISLLSMYFLMEIVHFQVCGKHLIGLAVQLMLPKYFHCPWKMHSLLLCTFICVYFHIRLRGKSIILMLFVLARNISQY